MKILIPTTEFPPDPGGVASLAYEQAVGLARLGHTVRVETLARGTDTWQPCASPVEGTEFVYREIGSGPVWRLGPLAANLLKALRSFRPDFIHSPTYRGYGLPLLVAASLKRVPYSVYLHGTELNTEQRSRMRRTIMGAVLNGATQIFTNSENTLRLLHGLYPKIGGKAAALQPGVHAQAFRTGETERRARGLRSEWLAEADPRSVVLLSVCRMHRSKGIQLVLQALERLLKRRPDLPLLYVVAGGGGELDAFRALASELGLDRSVRFLGPLPYGETAHVYRAADLYVQPSIPVGNFLESFGISFLEAQAAGLPCIGSNWGGVPEAVAAGETALLIPPGDLDALTGAIETLASDAGLRNSMSEKALRRAEAMDWSVHARKLSAIIQQKVQVPQ